MDMLWAAVTDVRLLTRRMLSGQTIRTSPTLGVAAGPRSWRRHVERYSSRAAWEAPAEARNGKKKSFGWGLSLRSSEALA